MASKLLPNGAGFDTGDIVATASPILIGGNLWYVDASTGTDSAGYGLSQESPAATLGYMIGIATAGDTIVLMDGHEETVTSPIALNKSLIIVGAGLSSGRPTAKLKLNSGTNTHSLIDITANQVWMRNIWFESPDQSSVSNQIEATSQTGLHFVDCYVECGVYVTNAYFVLTSCVDVDFSGTTFVATGTDIATRPNYGVSVATSLAGLNLSGTVFDGGSYGFYGFAFTASAAITMIFAPNVSFLRGADLNLISTSTGFLHLGTSTGGVRAGW